MGPSVLGNLRESINRFSRSMHIVRPNKLVWLQYSHFFVFSLTFQSFKTKTNNMADEATKLYDLLKKDTNCKPLLGKHLTADKLAALKDKKTKVNGTLADCIRSGCENTDSGVGIYACDPEGYTVFAPVLDEVIKDYHKVPELKHPPHDYGMDKIDFGDLDPSGEMIVSTRVRTGRSYLGKAFPPVITKEDRASIETAAMGAFDTFTGELAGKYHPLNAMTPDEKQQYTDDHFLFNDKDRFLRAAGGYRDWPNNRGIFFNKDKTFLIWVNEEDHLRLISMQKGGNLKEVYVRLIKAIEAMEEYNKSKGLEFAQREGLGYLTFCPSNLGTAIRASVHIKVPKLAKTEADLKAFCDQYNLQARGIHGEHTESVGGVYDISNKRRLGLTEFEAIQEMRKGIEAVIEKEKSL